MFKIEVIDIDEKGSDFVVALTGPDMAVAFEAAGPKHAVVLAELLHTFIHNHTLDYAELVE